MGIRKPLRELDSLSSILRTPSSNAQLRTEYIQQKKSGGCVLCGQKSKLAFYHRDPRTKDFNIQEAGLRVPQETLDAEIEKCVVLCVSCRMRILGDYRPPARITNKELFYELRKVWKAAQPAPLPKSSQKRHK